MDSLKSALGNRRQPYTFKGRVYQLEEWDLNDIADIEEALGDLSKLNPAKAAHQRLVLWIAMRRADDMLTPDERRMCRYRMLLEDVGHIVKAADLRGMETLAFVAAILKASGLYGDGENEKKDQAEELKEVEIASPGETSTPS